MKWWMIFAAVPFWLLGAWFLQTAYGNTKDRGYVPRPKREGHSKRRRVSKR